MHFEFKLPDIGEGLTEGEIVKWHVREGDEVRESQPLVSVLTDKAEVEIPSPKTGKVLRLAVREGQKVPVHSVLVVFDLGGEASSPAQRPAPASDKPAGNGAPRPTAQAPAAGQGLALPAVRKLAADLGVDLSGLRGSGPGGRVTEEDVRVVLASGKQAAGTQAGTEERIPFAGVRRRTAEKMTQSARAIPHVTHVDEADYTALLALRDELQGEAGKRGVKLGPLPFVVAALTRALKQFPDLNAVLDEAGGAIVRKRYYNVGVATDTEQGLVVPVVKDAGNKDLWALAAEIQRLAEKARAGKIELPDLQGGTFTVTNVGPIGGLFATPIVLHPEVGILGVMQVRKRPVFKDGSVQARDMGYLALSFDHRVIDGAQAARFTNVLVAFIENPRTLL